MMTPRAFFLRASVVMVAVISTSEDATNVFSKLEEISFQKALNADWLFPKGHLFGYEDNLPNGMIMVNSGLTEGTERLQKIYTLLEAIFDAPSLRFWAHILNDKCVLEFILYFLRNVARPYDAQYQFERLKYIKNSDDQNVGLLLLKYHDQAIGRLLFICSSLLLRISSLYISDQTSILLRLLTCYSENLDFDLNSLHSKFAVPPVFRGLLCDLLSHCACSPHTAIFDSILHHLPVEECHELVPKLKLALLRSVQSPARIAPLPHGPIVAALEAAVLCCAILRLYPQKFYTNFDSWSKTLDTFSQQQPCGGGSSSSSNSFSSPANQTDLIKSLFTVVIFILHYAPEEEHSPETALSIRRLRRFCFKAILSYMELPLVLEKENKDCPNEVIWKLIDFWSTFLGSFGQDDDVAIWHKLLDMNNSNKNLIDNSKNNSKVDSNSVLKMIIHDLFLLDFHKRIKEEWPLKYAIQDVESLEILRTIIQSDESSYAPENMANECSMLINQYQVEHVEQPPQQKNSIENKLRLINEVVGESVDVETIELIIRQNPQKSVEELVDMVLNQTSLDITFATTTVEQSPALPKHDKAVSRAVLALSNQQLVEEIRDAMREGDVITGDLEVMNLVPGLTPDPLEDEEDVFANSYNNIKEIQGTGPAVSNINDDDVSEDEEVSVPLAPTIGETEPLESHNGPECPEYKPKTGRPIINRHRKERMKGAVANHNRRDRHAKKYGFLTTQGHQQ